MERKHKVRYKKVNAIDINGKRTLVEYEYLGDGSVHVSNVV